MLSNKTISEDDRTKWEATIKTYEKELDVTWDPVRIEELNDSIAKINKYLSGPNQNGSLDGSSMNMTQSNEGLSPENIKKIEELQKKITRTNDVGEILQLEDDIDRIRRLGRIG